MSWTYHQSTGRLERDSGYITTGYSGKGNSKNRASDERVRDRGPIPRGRYRIGRSYQHPSKGPTTMNLDPIGHTAHGRTDFRIHGDSRRNPGTASEGCVILPRPVRDRIAASGDNELIVVE